MTRKPAKYLILASVIALTACGSVKRELGVDRNSPDEFMVVKRAPLSLPPDYNLRPPSDSAETRTSIAAPATAKTAEEVVLGKQEKNASQGSSEKALLEKLSAASASPDIRRQIEEDNGYISFKNRSVSDKLIFWADEAPSADKEVEEPLVDPAAEAARLKKNKDEGHPVTTGDVPVIEKKKSTLDKIF